MATDVVFCPKCGAQSVEPSRFCKRCGTNLEAVSRALTGTLAPAPVEGSDAAVDMEVTYASVYSKALYQLLTSIAVFIAMFAMFRGAWWVYFMLFWVASAVRDMVQATLLRKSITNPRAFQAAMDALKSEKDGKRKSRRKRRRDAEQPALQEPPRPVSFAEPTPMPAYIPPARTTGELEKPAGYDFDQSEPPPSITEGTTELLDKEVPPPLRADQRS